MWETDSDILTFISIIQDDAWALGRERVIHLGYAPGKPFQVSLFLGCTTLSATDPTTPSLTQSSAQKPKGHRAPVFICY